MGFWYVQPINYYYRIESHISLIIFFYRYLCNIELTKTINLNRPSPFIRTFALCERPLSYCCNTLIIGLFRSCESRLVLTYPVVLSYPLFKFLFRMMNIRNRTEWRSSVIFLPLFRYIHVPTLYATYWICLRMFSRGKFERGLPRQSLNQIHPRMILESEGMIIWLFGSDWFVDQWNNLNDFFFIAFSISIIINIMNNRILH